MPKSTETDRALLWHARIRQADRVYKEWSDRYDTARLEDYYLGRQWRGTAEEDAESKYVINLVYSSTETNRPALIFHNPQVRIQPRPGRSRTFASDAENRARLSQDTVQTFVDDEDLEFAEETALALQEAHFRFGVIEVGYSADWIDNPDAGKPLLKEKPDGTPVRDPDTGQTIVVRDSEGREVRQPRRRVSSERLYIKRIPANTFRVSLSSKNSLHRNDWVGYYEWHYLEDVKANKEYKNTADLQATGTISDKVSQEEDPAKKSSREGMIRIWKIWDIRAKVRHVLADGGNHFLRENVPFSYLPFSVIKFHEVLDSFYPMPPVYQWIGPQDEINETREMQRAHRRRFYRRYTVDPGVSDEELGKLETGGDGVYAKIPAAQAPRPVPDAPLAADVWRHLDESKSDFIQVSGVTSEQRGIAESETATQATILDARGRLRESSARQRVAKWLSATARLMLFTIRDNMALPFWVNMNVDPSAQGAAIASASVAERWRRITTADLGDTDMEVSVDLASMSPVTEEMMRNSWNQVMALLANPSVALILARSEVILRKTVALYGIRAESEIREIQRVAQEVAEMALAQTAMGARGQQSDSSIPAIGGPAPGIESALARFASINRQTQ